MENDNPSNQTQPTGQGPSDQSESSKTLPQAVPQMPPASAPTGHTSKQSLNVQNLQMPQIADDTDLIEKEWVDKAKDVVARTVHDPYLQNKELNKVRAEYLRKRYNKDIRQSD